MLKVTAKAPLRLGLAGGGTDISSYSEKYGGAVLNATISFYAHCEILKHNDRHTSFFAHDLGKSCVFEEDNDMLSSELILHRETHKLFLKDYNLDPADHLKVATYCDAPSGSGLGSSSTLVVCLVKAYATYLNLPLDHYEIAELAYYIERVVCGFTGGKQDQYAAVNGGFNFIEFFETGTVLVHPLRLHNDFVYYLEKRFLLFYTGQSRDSATIIQDQVNAIETSATKKLDNLHDLKAKSLDMRAALLQSDYEKICNILRSSWQSKKRTSDKITNPLIASIEEICKTHGADAFKISGAGGGGFMLVLCEPEFRFSIINKLSNMGITHYPFVFEQIGAVSWMSAE